MYETVWARHCAAVLMGKKPAALFSERASHVAELARENLLSGNGLHLVQLRQSGDRVLLFVYREKLLAEALNQPLARNALREAGYPVEGGLLAMLAYLGGQVRKSGGFPHEIGFFLGYPPEDVLGFMQHGGKHCKYSCLWKVYGDVEKAKRLCRVYAACRRFCCRHIETGGNLASLQMLVQTAG